MFSLKLYNFKIREKNEIRINHYKITKYDNLVTY